MGPQADGGSGPWTKGDSVAGDRSLEAPGPRGGAGSGPRSRAAWLGLSLTAKWDPTRACGAG